jgi:hypothetical protein
MLAPNVLRVYLALALALGATAATNGRAQTAAPTGAELPALQPGMWEYHRSMVVGERGKPQIASVKKCGDPTAEFKQKLVELKKKGCQFAPLMQSGNRYTSAWKCPVTGGSATVRDVITVKGSTGYQDDNEVRLPQQLTRSTILATRLGDCPANQQPPRARPTPPRR